MKDTQDAHLRFGSVPLLHTLLPILKGVDKRHIRVDHVHIGVLWIGRFKNVNNSVPLSESGFLVVLTQIVTRNEISSKEIRRFITAIALSDIQFMMDGVLPIARFLYYSPTVYSYDDSFLNV